MDDVAVADVDGHVAELVEEDEVAGLELGLILDPHRPHVELRGGEVRDRVAVLGPEPGDEARAVEAVG